MHLSQFLTLCLCFTLVAGDDGSYLKDSGGPVASNSEDEASGGTVDAGLQEALQKLDPCEAKLVPSLNNSMKPLGTPPPFGSFQPTTPSLTSLSKKDPEKFIQEVKEKFQKFIAQFNKTYPTEQDQKNAFNFFKENFEKLLKMGSQRRSPFDASFTAGKFSDMNFNSFQNSHTGALLPLGNEPSVPIDKSFLVKRDCPQLNWTSLDVIPPVRKQDQCGCCYAMSTADLVASQYSIDTGNYTKSLLSSQWISDCMQAPSGYKCNGGRAVKVLETLAKKNLWRIPTENCYPFTDKNGTCRYSKNCTDTPPISVKWGKMVNLNGPFEKELMAALLQHGPVVAIVGVSQAWQMYNGTGVIRPYQCTNDQNHAVLITGYDYTSCVPTYTIKNSWGTDWGGRGYVKVEAGKNTCHVAETIIVTCTADNCNKDDPIKYVLANAKHPLCK